MKSGSMFGDESLKEFGIEAVNVVHQFIEMILMLP